MPSAAWYCYLADRKAAIPKIHLAGVAGWMQSEGCAGFARRPAPAASQVTCLAHVVRSSHLTILIVVVSTSWHACRRPTATPNSAVGSQIANFERTRGGVALPQALTALTRVLGAPAEPAPKEGSDGFPGSVSGTGLGLGGLSASAGTPGRLLSVWRWVGKISKPSNPSLPM